MRHTLRRLIVQALANCVHCGNQPFKLRLRCGTCRGLIEYLRGDHTCLDRTLSSGSHRGELR